MDRKARARLEVFLRTLVRGLALCAALALFSGCVSFKSLDRPAGDGTYLGSKSVWWLYPPFPLEQSQQICAVQGETQREAVVKCKKVTFVD